MSRKLGDGYSLALNTGNGTHLTLVYFHKLKRGYEQDMVKQMASQYFADNDLEIINLNFGELYNIRSVKVHGEIERIVKELSELFNSFDIDANQVPHIDLRGNSMDSIDRVVSVVNNWYI
jgi:hypothetical protein